MHLSSMILFCLKLTYFVENIKTEFSLSAIWSKVSTFLRNEGLNEVSVSKLLIDTVC